MVSLHQPVAALWGSARSLGRATAELLHSKGYSVAVTDVDLEQATKVATSLDDTGQTARAYRLDVSKSGEVATVFDAVAAELGMAMALVNNAARNWHPTIRDRAWSGGTEQRAEIPLDEILSSWRMDSTTFHASLRDHIERRYTGGAISDGSE